jgi:predicted ABC-type transport system involved in lysophospholipase L1 biosynthesis ATPase subunit
MSSPGGSSGWRWPAHWPASPALLIADEPTAEQDSASRELVLARMLDISAVGGSLVLATHDPEVAQRCDRILDLRQLRTAPVSDPGLASR